MENPRHRRQRGAGHPRTTKRIEEDRPPSDTLLLGYIYGLYRVTDLSTALKNADTLLHDVLKAVDTSGDGQIQYNGRVGRTRYIQQRPILALTVLWRRVSGLRRACRARTLAAV